MNCKRELGNKISAELDPLAGTIPADSNSPTCQNNPGSSASSTRIVNCEESPRNILDKDEEGMPKSGTNGQILNEASSSELSIRSETLTGVNGDSLPTTDSDCRTSPVGKNWGKTTRQKSRKRKVKPLIPGYTKDWESNDSWTSEKAQEDCTVVAEEIETKRRKIKSLQQKNRRLKVRHSRLKAAIKEMKANMADRD